LAEETNTSKNTGNYKIFDYDYAIANGYIPEDYSVWWGYEDAKLFCFAKEEITNLASEDEPFNFTMLTADTHFEDGYCCELCQDEFDSQYANVMVHI
jgi:phosphoglycerol transferase